MAGRKQVRHVRRRAARKSIVRVRGCACRNSVVNGGIALSALAIGDEGTELEALSGEGLISNNIIKADKRTANVKFTALYLNKLDNAENGFQSDSPAATIVTGNVIHADYESKAEGVPFHGPLAIPSGYLCNVNNNVLIGGDPIPSQHNSVLFSQNTIHSSKLTGTHMSNITNNFTGAANLLTGSGSPLLF